MNETIIILMNMRGGCATVGNTVHTLFRLRNSRSRLTEAEAIEKDGRSSPLARVAVVSK